MKTYFYNILLERNEPIYDMAKRMGISGSTLYAVAQGRRKASVRTKFKIARFLGLAVEEIFRD